MIHVGSDAFVRARFDSNHARRTNAFAATGVLVVAANPKKIAAYWPNQ